MLLKVNVGDILYNVYGAFNTDETMKQSTGEYVTNKYRKV